MPTESDLRDLFGDTENPNQRGIDTAEVIRRSSRRRVAQRVTVGGATALAVAGVGVAGIVGIRSLGSQSLGTAASSAGQGQSPKALVPNVGGPAGSGTTARVPADRVNLCGRPLAPVAPSPAGLVLTTHFADGTASAASVTGTVTLTNTGAERVIGSTAAMPAITLSKDGITLWHSNGPAATLAVAVDLAPGASMSYRASFVPVTCTSGDDLGGGFRNDLPHVAPGDYQVSAAIELSRRNAEGSSAGDDLLIGPVSTVGLR